MASRLNSIARIFGIQVVRTSRLERLIGDASLQNRISRTLIQQAKGVLHIGGHFGEEAEEYNALGKPVLWVEGVPEYFKVLVENINKFPRQRALNYFLSDSHEIYLKFAKTLIVECSTYELYSTQAHFRQIADFLHGFGFINLFPMPEDSHGDVIFVNTVNKI